MAKSIKEVSFEDTLDKEVLQLCKDRNLSVSSVKYSRGHDGDCMNCNLKIGSKIVGTAWDDSWNGGLDVRDKSASVRVQGFNEQIQEIMSIAPKYTSKSLGIENMSYSYDMIIDTMVKEFEVLKDCKKKCLVMGTKIEADNARVDTFTFNVPFDNTPKQTEQIKSQMAKDGYVTIEIVNKRFV
jgi:hypothetical protein